MLRRTVCLIAAAALTASLAPYAVSQSSPRALPHDARSSTLLPANLAPIPPRSDPRAPEVPCLYIPPSSSLNSRQAVSTVVTPTWQFEAPMPTARHSFGLAVLPGTDSVYVIGGMQFVSQQAVTATDHYNACARTWESAAPLPVPLGFIGAAELGGKIYVVGGVDRLTAGTVLSGTYRVHSSTLVYDPQTDTWSAAANLPKALGGVAVAVANGKLYAFGGFDARGPGGGEVDTTYEYDPASNTWLTRTAILSGTRALATAASLNGKIYLVGGERPGPPYWNTVSSVHVYDPAVDAWSNAAPMIDGAHSSGLAVSPDGFLYAVGGGLQWSPLVVVQRYDPVANVWAYVYETFNDYSRVGAAAAYVGGRILLVGGAQNVYDVTTASVESLRLNNDFCESALRAEQATVEPGERITYTLELRSGRVALSQVDLIDPIPPGTQFAGFGLQPSGASYNAAQQRVEWSGSLAANQSPVTITFGVTVSSAGWLSGDRVTNTATFSNSLGQVLTRSATVQLAFFDLSPSTKWVDKTEVASGGALSYTLRVEQSSIHTGTATLVDPIPANTTYLAGSLASSAGSAAFAGNAVTWNGALPQWATHTNTSGNHEWGDSRGGGAIPGVRYEWIEISETGRQVGFYAPTFGRCYPVPFPFGFPFYGTYFTEAAVQIDGTLFFLDPGNTGLDMGPNNQPIPAVVPGYSAQRYIAVMWDDLYLAPGGMYYQVIGAAPNRRVVIQYHRTSRLDAGMLQYGTPGDWEIILHEGTGIIVLQYRDVEFGHSAYDFGASATVGIQNTPSQGVQYSYNAPTLSNELAIMFLPPGKSVPYPARHADITFGVRLADRLPDRMPITNTAIISDEAGNAINRQAVSLARGPNFSTSNMTVEPIAPRPGEVVTFTIYVRNSGALESAVNLSDAIPPGLTYVPDSLTTETGSGGVNDGVLTWTGNIWAGTQSPVRFRAQVNPAATHQQVITNTAVFTSAWLGEVFRPQATLVVDKPADVYVTQIGASTLYPPTETLTYTLTYGNAGPFATDGPISVTAALPAEATYLASAPTGVYVTATHSLVWNVGPLAFDGSHTLTALLSIPGSTPALSVLTNTASIASIPQDSNAANNASDWFTIVDSPVNLLNGARKSIDRVSVDPGSVVTYTLAVSNTGRAAATVSITDVIPLGASYLPGSSSVNSIPTNLFNSAQNRIEWSGLIPSGGAVTIRLCAIITAASGSIVTNTATIDDGAGIVFNRMIATLPVRRLIYLPLIMK